MDILRETNFESLGVKRVGKVRDMYEQDDRLILVTTDRHSSFDRIIAHVPGKGAILNTVSAFWFENTKDIVPNHVLALPDPNVTVGKKCSPLPIEVVIRGFLTGVTSTSLWTHYEAGKRDFGSFKLPDGMRKNQKLDRPVFTPSTKEAEHDKTVSPQEIVEAGLLSKDMLEQVEAVALSLFTRGQELALSRGLILVDTKYEFGIDENDALTLIDEIHTPDSSRWWQAASYKERTDQGMEPEYFDKEFLRLWFIEHSDPYGDAVLPEAPLELVEELSRRYHALYTQLTGNALEVSEEPIRARIERNLAPYVC